jgi:hypothetical protein
LYILTYQGTIYRIIPSSSWDSVVSMLSFSHVQSQTNKGKEFDWYLFDGWYMAMVKENMI